MYKGNPLMREYTYLCLSTFYILDIKNTHTPDVCK